MKYLHLCLIDDELTIHEIFKKLINDENKKILLFSAYKGKEGLSIIKKHPINIAFIDHELPDTKGIVILKYLRKNYPEIKCFMISGYKKKKLIKSFIKNGARDFILKPIEYSYLKIVFSRFIRNKNLTQAHIFMKQIIGKSKVMLDIFQKIIDLSYFNSPILILGESGTGKELFAKLIHHFSEKQSKKRPFIAINCAAIPKDLLESELFGHEKGAFTGAISKRIGAFELANNGTLFLDEIGDLDLDLQVKLLRVLQEKEIQPIGTHKKIKINVKIISATHQNLKLLIKQKKFREDLFFRISVIPISIPPLRERKEDIPILAQYFLKKMNEKYKMQKILLNSAIQQLVNHTWKGNVRELENFIQRIFFFQKNSTIFKIPKSFFEFRNEEKKDKKKKYMVLPLSEIEKRAIKKTLKILNYNISKSSMALNISRDTLYRKIKQYDIKILSYKKKL